ncbi:MAG TPA: Na(+)/H(+) antiporter subunit B [Rhizobiales bacterium]|nr:Na(+)/H(+) antiporter subunit B [Hyphomicrobiales bacterium]
MKLDLILRVTTKLLLPFILMFAFYVQFHGDFGPGGGFQAGAMTAAMIFLYSITYGLAAAQKAVPPIIAWKMIPLGVLIYAGVGVVAMFKGGQFLNYSVLGEEAPHSQALGVLLVESGVFITVAGTFISIFYAFAGRGR